MRNSYLSLRRKNNIRTNLFRGSGKFQWWISTRWDSIGKSLEGNLNFLLSTGKKWFGKGIPTMEEDRRISAEWKNEGGEGNFNVKRRKKNKIQPENRIDRKRRNCRDKKALQGHQEREYYRLKETGNGIPTIEEIAKGTSKIAVKGDRMKEIPTAKKNKKNGTRTREKKYQAAGIASRNRTTAKEIRDPI